jgi:hypothetical protein
VGRTSRRTPGWTAVAERHVRRSSEAATMVASSRGGGPCGTSGHWSPSAVLVSVAGAAVTAWAVLEAALPVAASAATPRVPVRPSIASVSATPGALLASGGKGDGDQEGRRGHVVPARAALEPIFPGGVLP